MNITTYIVNVTSDGTEFWNLNGKLHRAAGPAVKYLDGRQEWWFNGKLHRTDGPAVEAIDGGKYWWLNGMRHRADGPAMQWTDGNKAWWLNGKPVTEAECLENVKPRASGCADKIIQVNGFKYQLVED